MVDDDSKRLSSSASYCGYQVWTRLVCVILFATAMGFLEAICVVYLRRLIIPLGSDISQIVSSMRRFPIEHTREVCTIVILATVSWLAAFNGRTRIAMFFLMFGIWDITYYAGLKVFADWPGSWLKWDCLFLIPEPWYAPVLAPVLISAYFVLASCLLIIFEPTKRKLRLTISVLILQIIALVIWYWSFVKDSSRISSYGYDGITYSWMLFFSGLLCAVCGFFLAARGRRIPS